MKTAKILTLIMYLIVLPASAQGLMFNGMESPIEERTSYDVFASKRPKFTDVLRIEFSLSMYLPSDFGYILRIKNDEDGRISFWGDLDEYNKKMQKLRAVQNYNPEELVVEAGEEADSVVVHNTVQPTMAMAKCYMTVYVN